MRENRAKFHYDQRERDPKYKKIFGAARRLTAAPRRAKKVTFQWGGGRSRDVDIFLRFFLVGGSFYVILMKVHARTGPVAVAGFEKMLAKVKDFLHEVSL